MFTDALARLSDAQAFTTDAYSTYSYDCGNVTPKRSVGNGEPLCLAIAADTWGTGAGSYEFRLVQSANADLTSEDILVSIFPAESAITTGALFYIPIPANLVTKRYIGFAFNNVSGTTAVTLTVDIVPMSMIQAQKIYAKGYTIS